MLTVISPAKTLDFDTPPVTKKTSSPELLADSGQLMSIMRRQSPNDLMSLMGISQELAELNVQRFQDWNPPFDKNNARQAVLAFKGDVYLGMEAGTYTQRDFNFAQKNLRILSGLYGLLRPLDLIQPYRLEMGSHLPNNRGKDLYAFWGDRITHLLVDDLCTHRNKTLVNLASHEYFKSVNTSLLPAKLITPVFKDYSRGSYQVLGFFAKKARGSMASFIIRNRINRPADLKDFDTDGYRYNDELSTRNEWVFTRKT